MDYKQTLNLPDTTFPMRANAKEREPEIQRFWRDQDIYHQNLKRRQGAPRFVLHDGPPYLSSDRIHMGHALNKVLKDIVVKYQMLNGHQTPYVPGYDCHGLPIENAALKALGKRRSDLSVVELRARSRAFALSNLDGMQANFQRLGALGDWEHPYLTLTPDYCAAQLRVFGEMVEKGYIYKGLKPVYWCASCETALAEAEVEYADVISPSIYVRFRLQHPAEHLPEAGDRPVDAVIWTTTPWTLPANVAIALSQDLSYQLIDSSQGLLLVAADLRDALAGAIGLTQMRVLATRTGKELEGLISRHPFMDRSSPLVLGHHVTAEAGTGLVHTAPGHGPDDFIIGKKYHLPIISPVDGRGHFTSEVPFLEGMSLKEASPKVMAVLEEKGALLKADRLSHSYAHCWRCKNPTFFRATEQWFASVDRFRDAALAEIQRVKWIPAAGENRISSMVAQRADWCISRQRAWGVPIPAFYCTSCHQTLMNAQTVGHVANLVAEQGSDVWWTKEASELLPAGTQCPCGNRGFTKETDIMDVWFDSGTSWATVQEQRPELTMPCDLYLEGSDQHRGWFQSSLLTAVATRGQAPYRTVLTHGFVLDGQGRKMSKSLGNIIEPQQVTDQYGADVLRLWAASVDYSNDVRVSPEILKQLSEIYRKIRNTARFLLGNLQDFDPHQHRSEVDQMPELERYALHRFHVVRQEISEAFQTYQIYRFYQIIQNYCVVDLSNFYLDLSKDLLYVLPANHPDRRATQTVMYRILMGLTGMVAPVLSHLAEDIWQHMGERLRGTVASVFLSDYPQEEASYNQPQLAERWARLGAVRDKVNKALEMARIAKQIGAPLEARVVLWSDNPALQTLLEGSNNLLPRLFHTSQVEWAAGPLASPTHQDSDLQVEVLPATGAKCERCWHFESSVGQHPSHPTLCASCVSAIG